MSGCIGNLCLGPAYYATAAVVARASLALLGAGEPLLWRPEVTTPLNSLLGVREGLRMLQLGLSPYAGASSHAPPLVLALHAATAAHPLLYALPNTVADALAALALWRLASLLCKGRSAEASGMLLGPASLAAAYLWNPLGILATIGGTTTPLENLAVMAALLGGAARNAPLAAAGLAAGTYVGLHPLLLGVPLAIMFGRGCEDVTQLCDARTAGSGSLASQQGGGISSSGGAGAGGGEAGSGVETSRQAAGTGSKPVAAAAAAAARGLERKRERFEWMRCAEFAVFAVVWGGALLWLSDLFLRAHPEAQCLPRLAAWATAAAPPAAAGHGACWLRASHGFALAVDDYTPNIGLFWYLLTELFDAFRPFFTFVLHSHAVIFAAPLALRFPGRPLFVAWALLLACAALRPYPSAGDLAPWMALAPLALAQQLRQLRSALFLVNALVLLAVLGPAMWSQWIIVDAANPNFFYSITLLLGVFYVVMLVQAVLLTVRVERLAAGKVVDDGLGGDGGSGSGGCNDGSIGAAAPRTAAVEANGSVVE